MNKFVIFLLLVFIVSCNSKVPHIKKEFSRIAFLSNRESPKGKFDIFIMDTDGNNPQNISKKINSITTFSSLVLSPNGKKLLFITMDGTGVFLSTLNLADTGLTKLAKVDLNIRDYSFSPLGDKILFQWKKDKRKQIFIMNSDGTDLKAISRNNLDEYDPVFSPDEKSIIFVSESGGNYSLIKTDFAGKSREILVKMKREIKDPVISNDGKMICFTSYEKNKKTSDLFIIKSNGKDIKNITQNNYHNFNPKFSPDGKKIVFLARPRGWGYTDVCIIDVNGENFKNLTFDSNSRNVNPVFSSDGKSIIFESTLYSNNDIYKTDIDGKKILNLTQNKAWDKSPAL